MTYKIPCTQCLGRGQMELEMSVVGDIESAKVLYMCDNCNGAGFFYQEDDDEPEDDED